MLVQQQHQHSQYHHDRPPPPSLEQISHFRRSSTAAALRRGTIKISEPVLLQNSGPSPVWPPATEALLLHGNDDCDSSADEDEVKVPEDLGGARRSRVAQAGKRERNGAVSMSEQELLSSLPHSSQLTGAPMWRPMRCLVRALRSLNVESHAGHSQGRRRFPDFVQNAMVLRWAVVTL